MANGTIAEKVTKIKTLVSPDASNPEVNPKRHRQRIIWEITDISQSRDPEAVAALIDLALYEEFDEYDEGYVSEELTILRVSHCAVRGLLFYALTELPVIPSPDLPDYPSFDPSDPERRKATLRDYYAYYYEDALRDCRAWCQEVRGGKRTFQIKGSKLRYNALGKPVNAPPPRTHKRNPPDSQAEESRSPTAESHPATHWIVALLTLVIVITMIRLHRKN